MCGSWEQSEENSMKHLSNGKSMSMQSSLWQVNGMRQEQIQHTRERISLNSADNTAQIGR